MRTDFRPGESPQAPGAVSEAVAQWLDVREIRAEDGVVVIPNRELLLTSMYSRAGVDLVISTPDGVKYIVKGFFLNDHLPTISDGASTHIPGELAGQFAGSIAPEQYAAAAPGAPGPVAGVVRSLTGVVNVVRASDGSVVQLKIGDPLYQDDIVETEGGAQVGLVFVDGTTLALGENGELVLDELVYDPSKAAGKGTLRLVSGAAEFVSGGIAKSGADNMVFQTPVATIGIRGTRVLATYDPNTGDVTVVNRPTGTDAAGNETAGRITLTLPNGTVIGDAIQGNNGWQWNADPATGLPNTQPTVVQFTPQQIQNIAGAVLDTVNNLQTQIQQQPNLIPTPQGGGTNAPASGPAGPGGDAGGANAAGADAGAGGGQAPADGAAPADGTAPAGGTPPTTPPPQTTQTPGINTGNVAGNLATTGNPNAGTGTQGTAQGTAQGTGGTQNAGGTTGAGTGIGTNTNTNTNTTGTNPVQAPTQPVVQPPLPPPNPVLFNIEGGSTTDAAQSTITFTITRSGNVGVSASVNYATASGSAGAGVDFTANAGTVNFAPGETSKTVTITVLANANGEPEESFSVSLNGASAGSGAAANIIGGSASGTIAADPPLPSLSIAGVTVTDAAAGTAVLTITRTGPLDVPTTVGYQTAPGSAAEGSDFTPASGSVTFAAGQASAQVTVNITPDSATTGGEGAETFTVTLVNPTGGLIEPNGGVASVVIEADPLANFSIAAGAPVIEGGVATLTVTRSGDLSRIVAVSYTSESGTATVGTDTGATSGLVTFGPGVTSQTISIPIPIDAVQEQAESFTVTLGNPVGGTISQASATVSILADPQANYTINSVSVAEGATAVLTVTRSGDLTVPGSISYTTVPNSAASPGDFESASGTLTFAVGQATANISIPIVRDNVQEQAESFTVQLSNAIGGTITAGTGTVSVTADPPLPSVSIVGGSASDATPGTLTFTIILSAPATEIITVNYATENGSATAGSDFTGTSGSVTFQAGQTTQTVSVDIAANATNEPEESFTMRLTGAVGAVIAAAAASGTILADPTAPVPNIILSGGTTVSDATATSVVFTVTLSTATTVPVTVNYATVSGTANSSDYAPQSGTLTFPAGTTTQTVTVPIHAFGTNESAETFSLTLSGATGGVISVGTALVTISADPPAVSDTIANLLATQGSYNNQNVIVTDSASIADIKIIDTANGTGIVTPTTIADTASNVMRNGGYVGTTTNIAFTDTVEVEILKDFDIKTSGMVSAVKVSGTASVLLGSGAAYITNKPVEVIATPTLTNAQLSNINTANGTGSVTVAGSGAQLHALITASVITSSYNVRIVGPVSIADLQAIQAVVPGATFGAIEDTGANIMTFVNGGGNIAGHPAIVTASGGPMSTNLTNIDGANGTNPPGTVTIRGTLANLLAADNFGGRQVTITSGISGFSSGNATTLTGMGASLVAVEDTAQNIITAGVSGSYSVQLLGNPSISEITQVDALAVTVLYGAVADTAANLIAGSARLTAFPNTVPIITSTPTVAEVQQIMGYVNGPVGLMMPASGLEALVTTFAGTLLPIVPMITGAATIQQLLNIDPISPLATSVGQITDSYANISANLNFVTGNVSLTITDPITTGQYNLLDALTTGTITYTPAAANDSPVFAGAIDGNTFIQFDGTDDGLVSNNSWTNLQSHTIELWFRTSDTGVQSLGGVGTKADLYLNTTGQLALDMIDNGESKFVIGGPALNDGQWHHVAYTFNHTTGAVEFYIDGAPVTEVDDGGTLGLGDNFTTPFSVTGPFHFGTPAPFRGDIGDIRVWDAARTPVQIQNYYNGPVDAGAPNLKVWYTFEDYNDDDGSVSNIATAGGSGFDGTGSGASGALPRPTQADTDISQALNFNGTSTYVDTSIRDLSGSFTLTASFRMDVLPAGVFTIFGKGGSGAANNDLQVYVNSGGGLEFAMFDGSTFNFVTSTETLQAGIWYSVAVTYDSTTGGMEMFLNGEPTGTPEILALRKHDGSDALTIGRMNGGEYFDGDISRVTVWETVLDVNDIDDLTNTSVPIMNQTGLVAAYPFTDSVGSTWVTDAVSGGHNIYSGQVGTGGTWNAAAPPVARDNYTFNMVEDTPFTFRVVGRDPENAALTFGVGSVTGGTLSAARFVNATTREYTFTPTGDMSGAAQATITISDGVNPPVSQVITFNIGAVNDRPIILGLNDLPDVGDDDLDPPGQQISAMFTGTNFLDPDDGDDTIDGLVIVGNTADPNTHGAWQWSVDGTTWSDIGTVANDGTALVLSASSYLRFLASPTGVLGNMPSLTVRALDGTYNGTFSTGSAVTLGDQAPGKVIVMGPPTSIGVEVFNLIAPPVVLPVAPSPYAQLDGVDDHFESNGGVALTSHTMEAWIRVDPANSNEMLIVGVGETTAYTRMLIDEGVLIVEVEFGGNAKRFVANGAGIITDSGWHNVGYSFNASTGSIALYVDGEAITANATLNQTITGFTVADDIYLGGYSASKFFEGGMGNVRIWSDVRTPTEIEANYLFGGPPDDTDLEALFVPGVIFSGTLYNSSSGSAGDLDALGGIRTIMDTPYGLHFDGVDDVANITTLTDLPGSFTIEARVRLSDTSGERVIASKNASGGSNTEFILLVNNSNQLELRMGNGSTTTIFSGNGLTLADDTWYDVAAVYDNDSSTGNVILYVDGAPIQVGSYLASDFASANRQVSAQSVHIGQAFEGDISSLRIWEVAVDAGNIATYAASPPSPDMAGIVADYRFTQGTNVTIGGQTAIADSSGAGHHAIISGGSNNPTWFEDQLRLTDGAVATHYVSTPEDTPLSITLTAYDPEGGAITYLLQNAPSNGTVTFDQNGHVLYTPDANFSSVDVFTIRATTGGASTDQQIWVTVAAVNDPPSLDQNVTFPVDQGAAASDARSFYDYFAGHFVDDGSFVGVAVVGNAANPTTEGKYQFFDDVNDIWVDMPTTLDNEGNGWIFSVDAQIRFVPVNAGYSGTPGALRLRALDQYYGGTYTDQVSSLTGGYQVTVIEGRSYGVRLGNTVVLTAMVVPLLEWDGGASGDWSVATNWSTNVAPGSTDSVHIDGPAAVSYSAAGTVNINKLSIENGDLTITNAAGVIHTTGRIDIDSLSFVQVHGALNAGGNVQNDGEIELANDGTFSTGGILFNDGSFDVLNDGAISAVDSIINGGDLTFKYGTTSVQGNFENSASGLMLFEASDSGDTLVNFSNYNQWRNYGEMRFTANGTGTDDDVIVAFQDLDEVENYGVMNFEAGTGGGRRLVYTDFRNKSGGIINIKTDTTFAGQDYEGQEGSKLLIFSGKTLTIESGALKVDTTNFGGPPSFPFGGVLGGALHIMGGATLSTEMTPVGPGHAYDFEIGASGGRLTLIMGEQGGANAFWEGHGGSGITYAAEITGTVNMYSATVDVTMLPTTYGGSGEINVIDASSTGWGNLDSVTWRRSMNVGDGATLNIAANTSNSTLTVNDSLLSYQTLTNSGTINLTPTGGNAALLMSGSSFNNYGEVILQAGPGTVSVELDTGGGHEFRNRSGGLFEVNNAAAFFVGTFVNSYLSSELATTLRIKDLSNDGTDAVLTITGSFTNNTKGTLELASVSGGEDARLVIAGAATLGGILTIDGDAYHTAASGHVFDDAIAWGSYSGMFSDITGLVSNDGTVALDPVFSSGGLDLVAKTVDQAFTSSADTLTMAATTGAALYGGNGNDTLTGNLGSDVLIGGDGDDILMGKGGADRLIGGIGSDTVSYATEGTGVTVNLALQTATDGGGNTDTLFGIENIIGSSLTDTLIGDGEVNVIQGGGGPDTLTGGGGADTFVLTGAGDGGDTITDFSVGEDSLLLQETNALEFGLLNGVVVSGVNFSSISGDYDGTNPGTNTQYLAGLPTLIYSESTSKLYFDANGIGSNGYTVLATITGAGASLTAGDIVIDSYL